MKTVVNAGIILPKENYLEKGKRPGSATEMTEGVDKSIRSITPTVDVKSGITNIYEKDGKFFREFNGKIMEITNISERLKARAIPLPSKDIEK